MDKEKLLRDIGSDLETMQAHIKRLRKKKQDIHQLDVDLLLDKTRQLYEKLLNIDKTDESNQKAIVLPETMPEAEIPEVAFSTQGIGSGALVVEEKEEEKLKEEIEVKKEEKEVKKKVVKEEEKVVEVENAVEEKIEEKKEADKQAELKAKDDAAKKAESTSVGRRRMEEFGDPVGNYNKVDKPKEPEKEEPAVSDVDEAAASRTAFDLFSSNAEETIADKLGKKDDATIADKIGQSQIADLRQAIGINEKFLFINELFNGDLGRYNKAIDEFNSLKSQQGVDTYLLEMKIQNQWADDGEAYIKLKALLDRKFG